MDFEFRQNSEGFWIVDMYLNGNKYQTIESKIKSKKRIEKIAKKTLNKICKGLKKDGSIENFQFIE